MKSVFEYYEKRYRNVMYYYYYYLQKLMTKISTGLVFEYRKTEID